MTVTIRDVAARAGVSVGTVSNVLNARANVTADAADRVRAAIAELGYVRNDAARQLRAGRSRGIGLVVLDVGNPFFAAVARGAERRAAEAGMVVLLGSSEQDANREASYLDLFREQRVNGVLVSPASEDLSALARLTASGIPVTLVDREAPDSGLASVAVDDDEGGYLATAHLLSEGRRRLAYVGGPLGTRQVADRLAGARRAVAEVPGAALEVIECAGMTVLHGRAAGEELRARALAERPDAVFAANDLLAMGVLQALSMLADVRVPDDIALVGYDDIDFAAAAVVPLTSVRQPAELIGWTAVDLVLRQAAGTLATADATVRFRPELVVRASTTG
jgi:LacI family transcriptional regulator